MIQTLASVQPLSSLINHALKRRNVVKGYTTLRDLPAKLCCAPTAKIVADLCRSRRSFVRFPTKNCSHLFSHLPSSASCLSFALYHVSVLGDPGLYLRCFRRPHFKMIPRLLLLGPCSLRIPQVRGRAHINCLTSAISFLSLHDHPGSFSLLDAPPHFASTPTSL
jgi:hypothetical protein